MFYFIFQNDQKNADNIILENIAFIDGDKKSLSDDTFIDKRIFHYQDLINSDGIIDSEITNKIEPDDGAVIMFTSGTTGKPKAALQSHFTLLNNNLLYTSQFNNSDTTKVKVCTPLPLYHTFAGTMGSLGMSCIPIGMGKPEFINN